MAFGNLHIDRSAHLALFAAVLARTRQAFHAADIALAARGDAIANPMFFAHDLTVQLAVVALFFFEYLVAPFLKIAKALVQTARHAEIEPDR